MSVGEVVTPPPEHADLAHGQVTDFIVKVWERCNLACDYCYMYEGPDKSFRDRPRNMSEQTFSQFAAQMCAYKRTGQEGSLRHLPWRRAHATVTGILPECRPCGERRHASRDSRPFQHPDQRNPPDPCGGGWYPHRFKTDAHPLFGELPVYHPDWLKLCVTNA